MSSSSPSRNSIGGACDIRPARSDRATGKGRRRRAAAKQRVAEQQHWNRLMRDSEDETVVAPRPVNRRQSRRVSQNWDEDEDFEDSFTFDGIDNDDDLDLDVALALSLSLFEAFNGANGVTGAPNMVPLSEGGLLDMSYANLVRLENVKCTASPTIITSMCGHIFTKNGHSSSSKSTDELCTICQVEYHEGDPLMLLPCMHVYHDICGSEWFLKHSKLCPLCKHDITMADDTTEEA